MTTHKLWRVVFDCFSSVFASTTLSSTKTPSPHVIVKLGQGDHTTYIEGKTND